ncbi:MAG: 2OG-Fe(II) oxygenase family protein [Lysobacterales bacterium]
MLELLNTSTDYRRPAHGLRQRGFTQVPNFLEAKFARSLHQCLVSQVPWTLACNTQQGSQTIDADALRRMDDGARAELESQIAAQARQGFGFAYESYMMVTAYLEKRDPGLLLHTVLELLNHPATLSLLQQVTGDSSVTRLDAQATCYRPGHFLRFHDDLEETERRRFAFVLNLSQHWQADWGGLLQLMQGRSQVLATLTPTFNSLTLFEVPREHCVSMVTPFAGEPRLAITGWLKQ